MISSKALFNQNDNCHISPCVKSCLMFNDAFILVQLFDTRLYEAKKIKI